MQCARKPLLNAVVGHRRSERIDVVDDRHTIDPLGERQGVVCFAPRYGRDRVGDAAFCVAHSGKTESRRWIIALFPPVLAVVDGILGAGWSTLSFCPQRYDGWTGGILHGIDQSLVSVLCAGFGFFFALALLRGPGRWQRTCGVLFGVYFLCVLGYMMIGNLPWDLPTRNCGEEFCPSFATAFTPS